MDEDNATQYKCIPKCRGDYTRSVSRRRQVHSLTQFTPGMKPRNDVAASVWYVLVCMMEDWNVSNRVLSNEKTGI